MIKKKYLLCKNKFAWCGCANSFMDQVSNTGEYFTEMQRQSHPAVTRPKGLLDPKNHSRINLEMLQITVMMKWEFSR